MQTKVMTTTVQYDQLSVADTSKTFNIFTTTPNIYIMAFFARVKTAFTGVTGPTVKLGTDKTTDAYIESQGIDHAGDLLVQHEVAYRSALTHPIGCHASISHQSTPKNIPILATFGSTSGNLSSLTAGEIEFVCVYVE